MKKIAFFDFDGTITTKDTMLGVIKFQKGKAAFYTGFFINSPFLIGLKLKVVSNQFAKEQILKYFFAGMDSLSFQKSCDLFIANVLPSFIRPAAIKEIRKLQSRGFEIVVVSASAENWIKNWCDTTGVQLIASKLEIIEQMVTGKLNGKNCNGEEKAVRIKACYNLSEYEEIRCYGDSSGDKQMLALATESFFKPFR